MVNAHVVEGRIVKISTDPRKWTFELPPLHACVRGFGQVERVYHPDRLKQPLRRTGPRGSGRFEPISWDAALDEVAREMLRIRDAYGNAAILDASRSGNTVHAPQPAPPPSASSTCSAAARSCGRTCRRRRRSSRCT